MQTLARKIIVNAPYYLPFATTPSRDVLEDYSGKLDVPVKVLNKLAKFKL